MQQSVDILKWLLILKNLYVFFFLDEKERKSQDKTICSTLSHSAPRFVRLALGFQIAMVTQTRGRRPRTMRTKSFLSQAGQFVRQEKIWVGIRGALSLLRLAHRFYCFGLR